MSNQSSTTTMRALSLYSTSSPPQVEDIIIPEPTWGSAVVRVLAANVISYMREVYNGTRQYSFPTPMVPGTSFIGRVATTGLDAVKLKSGDLVFVDSLIRARDDPSDLCLGGLHDGHTGTGKKLMRDAWRNWSYAEYCRVPLENMHVLNEERLCGSPIRGGLGYGIAELGFISALAVPYGGLRDIELKAGQMVIIAPATGPFGGAAVVMALAIGARVIAMGRNNKVLERLVQQHPGRVEAVQITGDMHGDCEALRSFGRIDAYFDIGPKMAQQSSHLRSAILSLRHGGRVSLMGGYREDVAIPHAFIMHRNIRLYGKWMYDREDVEDLISMAENGVLKLGAAIGSRVMGEFALEDWKEAWDCATENSEMGQLTLIKP